MSALQPLRNDSGMALILVLAVIAALLAGGLHLARQTGQQAMAVGARADQALAREDAMAGIHLAMALLIRDAGESETDSLQEDWARPEKLAGAAAAMGYGPKELSLEIRDELGKLQVNALMAQFPGHEGNPDQIRLWEAFFTPYAREPLAVVNCLCDWLDSRDDEAITGISGAESDDYLSRDPAYEAANSPFNHISELFLVKGISLKMFRPDPDDPDDLDGPAPEEGVDLEELVTARGLDSLWAQGRYRYPGRVNINTAPVPVLRALLDAISGHTMGERAGDLAAYREERVETGGDFTNSLDKGWVGQVIELSGKESAALDRIIQYRSDLFSVRSRSVRHQAGVTLSALVRREKDNLSGNWSCRIIELKRED